MRQHTVLQPLVLVSLCQLKTTTAPDPLKDATGRKHLLNMNDQLRLFASISMYHVLGI